MSTRKIALTIVLSALALLLVGVTLIIVHARVSDDCQSSNYFADDYCG